MVNVYEYFKKHPKYNKLVGNDFLFVEYKCPIDIEQFQLWTATHLITYVINGKKDWVSPNKTYNLSAGNALFVRNGVYTTKQYLEEDYCVMLFFINDAFIKKFMANNQSFRSDTNLTTKHNLIFDIHTDQPFTLLIESIFHYLKQGVEIPQNLVEIKFKELLFNIVLNPKNKSILNFFNAIDQSTKISIESMMNENFKYDLKMEEYAQLCGRSLSTFKRDFKDIYKTTPSKWLINKRLEHAKTLLLSTNLNIKEICYESGFKNCPHFIQSFKKKYSITPNKFKTQHTNN